MKPRGQKANALQLRPRQLPKAAACSLAAACLLLSLPRASAQSAPLPSNTNPAPQTTTNPNPTPTGGQIHGAVHAGPTPLPGVSITATNTLTGKRYSAATDLNGVFQMAIPRNGRYVLRAELAGFAPSTSEVLLNAQSENGGKPVATAQFTLELASRAAARNANSETNSSGNAAARALSSALGRGTLSLNPLVSGADATATGVSTGAEGAQLPSLGSDTASLSTESVAVNGAAGQTNGLASVNEDEIRRRVEDAMAQARQAGGAQGDIANAVAGMLGGLMSGSGGFGGGGGRGGGGRGGGGFRNFNPTQPHGSVFYAGGNGALDATNFSLSGRPIQPAYSNNRFGVTFAGSPFLPGLTKPSTKQFVFFNLTGQRNLNPINLYGTVPTLAERTGDFSALTQTVNGAPAQVSLYDPSTGLPFANNVIPTSRLTPQALALLSFYPAPNVTEAGTQGYNYQTVTTAGSNLANVSLRFVRNFGAAGPGGFGGGGRGGGGGGGNTTGPKTLRQNINFNGSYSHSASALRALITPGGGSQESDGYGVTAGYTVSYGRLNNNSSVNWNRSRNTTRNYFTETPVDPATSSGVAVPSRGLSSIPAGFYNGLPNLTITNFSSLTEVTPRDSIGQTISFSDFVSWSHKRHNARFGIDIRRVHADSVGGNNVAGNFIFSGYSTQSPTDRALVDAGKTAQGLTGAGFADFLLGQPQSTTLQAGLSKIYLRENVYDWYAQDDWRLLPNLTLNFGLRYEYFSPYVEKNNRLVNLDYNSDFTAVSPVLPGASGPFSGSFPRSLVNPDRTMFSPRFGLAWRPKQLKNTVVRGGYGINYNTGQFGAFAQSLAFQPPFALTETNVLATSSNPSGCTFANLTLASGFGCSTKPVQNNYAVNRDYRLGRVQVYNLDFQRSLPDGIVLNLGYNGSRGGDLDILRAPNHTPTTVTTAGAQAFTFEDSLAESRFNALVVNARKRLQKGVALQLTYQYGHSIDNASSIGGSGNSTTAQNDQRLDLEEGNSTFDVRQRLTGNWVLELPFGPNRAFLNKGGRASKLLDGFSFSGDYTFATGSYFTPQYSSSAAQIAAGGTYTLRPDRVFSQPINGPGKLGQWFNPAAFVAPSNGFGTASRNSVRGPGIIGVDSSLSRTISLGDTRSFEARITASNTFNTVQYSGINTFLNSSTFGQVTGVQPARRLTFQARYRF